MVREGTVGVDGAAQDKAELLADQTPEPLRPLLGRQCVQLGAECVPVDFGLPGGSKRFGEREMFSERSQPRCSNDRDITGVAAVVAQQSLEGVRALDRSDHCALLTFCQGSGPAYLRPG